MKVDLIQMQHMLGAPSVEQNLIFYLIARDNGT